MKHFDHDRLEVYALARDYVRWLRGFLEAAKAPGWSSVLDQLRRSGASIPLNVAEGSGEFTAAEKNRFFRIAKRSATESAAALDCLVDAAATTEDHIAPGKELLFRIVCMLVRLIQSNAPRDQARP